MKLGELCRIIGGVPYGIDYDKDISQVAHIKRNIEEGCLFFAFRTWRVDTYANIFKAIEKGVAAIVTEKYIPDYPCIVVEDSHKAFMDVCKWYRKQMDIDVIAISGSIGKTSTKEMIACVVEQAFCMEKNDQNGNSSDLAARNVINLDCATEMLVQEVAIQNIHDTSVMIKPTISVLTNIGYSHAETFGSRENIFAEKTKLTDGMDPEGLLVLNADDDMLAEYAMKMAAKYHVLTYAIDNREADIRAEKISKNADGYSFEICYKGEKIKAGILCQGKHNVLNALAAFAVGIHLGMEKSDILKGIEAFQPSGYRQNIIEIDSMQILADCFNAAPNSVKAALDTLESMDIKNGGKRIAILGDMLELGEYSRSLHEEVGLYLNEKNIDIAVLYGNEVQYAKNKITNTDIEIIHVVKKKDLLDIIKQKVISENNIILFKGSHGMELEGVLDELFGTKFAKPIHENDYVCEQLRRENCNLEEYFRNKGCKTAALYGISVESDDLINMFENAGVHVKYAIDRKAKYLPEGLYKIPVIPLEEATNDVDLVFISLPVVEDSLVSDIVEKTKADILTYRKLVKELIG